MGHIDGYRRMRMCIQGPPCIQSKSTSLIALIVL